MLKKTGSFVLLTSTFLGVQGFTLAAKAQSLGIPDLPSPAQKAVCLNDWEQSIKAIGQAIGDPTITADYREQLVDFLYQLQEWRAVRAKVAGFSGCEDIALSVNNAIPVNVPSAPLDFEAAFQSVQMQKSAPKGYINYEGRRDLEFSDRSCWVIDGYGKRIDLSSMCYVR